MTIGRAMKFIDLAQVDAELRAALNETSSVQQLNEVLKQRDLAFSPSDFEEAFNYRHVNCQSEDQADQLKQFKLWWKILHQVNNGAAEEPKSDCESASQCSSSGGCQTCGCE